MADLSEMVNYVKAQQPHNGLAETAAHFVEGASRGYDAGHAEAEKKAQQNRDNPMVTDTLGLAGTPGGQVPVDVYSKLLDVKDKMLNIDNNNATLAFMKEHSDALDTGNRQTSLAGLAASAGGAAGTPPTQQGRVAGIMADPNTAGTPRKPTKTTYSMSGGKSNVSMEFSDPKTQTAAQVDAIKAYADKGDIKALTAAFPDGIPDGAAKIIEMHMATKQKQAAIDDAKNQIRQDRLEKQYRDAQTSVRGDPTIAHVETQRDAAITAYNRINEIEKSGQEMNPVDYVDVLGQIYKARTGAAPSNDVLAEARQNTAKGQAGKVYTYFTGQQAPATTKDIQDSLKNMAASMGSQADKLHDGYMRTRLKPPTGLEPDRMASIDAGRGLSFQEATGYQPDQSGSKGAGGKIKVSNGKETLMIDPADAKDAAKDGYKQL